VGRSPRIRTDSSQQACAAGRMRGALRPWSDPRMDHITFARFSDRHQAAAGIRGMRARGAHGVRIAVHPGAYDAAAFEESLRHGGDFGDSDLRHALALGVAAGLLGGAGVGVTLAAFSVFPGTLLQGALFGGFMGALAAFLVVSLLGPNLVDHRLHKLVKGLRASEVVVTVHTDDREAADRVREALEASGARVAEKSVA
jgi:hypothetical protein